MHFSLKTKKHAAPETSRNYVQILGAVNQIRTGDLFLTKEVLYQLSYNSVFDFLFSRYQCDSTIYIISRTIKSVKKKQNVLRKQNII